MTPTDLDTNSQAGGSENGDDRGTRAASGTEKARRPASEAYESARERTNALYGNARQRAGAAIESTREAAGRARQRSADAFDANPMSAVVGGLALGALVAAVLPRTRRETEVLGTLGGRINERAREAAFAARDAGRDKLEELGLTPEAAKQKLGEAASSASEAMRTTASAAAKAARGSR